MRALINLLLTKFFTWRVLLHYPVLRKAYAIQSHLTAQERYELFRLAIGKQRILEIGSYLGASATCFGSALKNTSGKIYCIDTWNNDAMTEGKKETFELFAQNTAPFKENIIPVRGFSTAVVDNVLALTTTLDLLFIDGDHSYEGVKADWEAYKSFLHPGSIVIFHDIGWAEGVQRVVREDAKPVVTSSGELPNLWWGVIA
jgi:predicted O-methyltransferase YrrM